MSNIPKEPTLQEIVIAALLHDIGKFYQRASNSGALKEDDIKIYCPNITGSYSYKHAGYTAKFFDENKDIFKCFSSYEGIRDISAMHHNPNTIFQKIIAIADSISAGIDRLENRSDSKNYLKFREIPLTSIFSLIKFKESENNLRCYDLNYLGYQTVYPKSNNEINQKSYENIYKQFLEEIKNINKDFYLFFESMLLRLMEKYLWCIPSATNDELKDISLYDHSYTTASIASTLYLYLKDKYKGNWENCQNDLNKNINEIINDENIEFARLLKVDTSGIQNYLYDLRRAGYSAKMLRARSFEISFMSKAIAHKIKDELGLDQVNILFEGGGNLLMIIPSNGSYIDKLEKLQEDIEKEMFERYIGELVFVFSLTKPIKLSDFLLNNFNNIVRKDLEQSSEIAKLKKNQKVLRNRGHIFGKIYEKLVDKIKEGFEICPVCDKRPSNKNNEDGCCDICSNLIKLGGKLTKSEYLMIIKDKNSNYNNLFLDLQLDIGENLDINRYKNNIENILQIYGIKRNYYGLRYSNPYHVPQIDDRILTFEELGNIATGNDKIAMLKGDVNNLGAIFWFGIQRKIKKNQTEIKENILTLSRYASLSRMFDFFFTEVLVKLIETGDKWYSIPVISKNIKEENISKTTEKLYYKDRIYVVYSGGDDFVLVGSWDAIFDFAIELNNEFTKFVGENKEVDFSCSIEIFNKKTPPLFMAEVCEESLKEVKKNKDKYNISAFGELLNWADFKNAIENGKKLIQFMDEVEGCSRSFMYRLLKITRMKKDFDKGKNVLKNAKYKALFKYSFARNIGEKMKGKEKERSNLEDFFIKNIIENEGGVVAVQYALQATKKR